MKEKIREFFKFKWMLVSNRPQHFVVVFIIGLFLGIEAAFAASATAEFKDWMWNGYKGSTWGWIKGNGFDWYDFLASMIGGLVGYGLRISCCLLFVVCCLLFVVCCLLFSVWTQSEPDLK